MGVILRFDLRHKLNEDAPSLWKRRKAKIAT